MSYGELLDKVKTKLGVETDYKLAKACEIDTGKISAYRRGTRAPDNYAIARFAQVLGVDPWTLLKEVERQTEKNPKRKEFWDKAASVAIGAIVSVTFFVTPSPANALPYAQVLDNSVYYVKLTRVLRRLKQVFLKALAVCRPPVLRRPFVFQVDQVAT